MRNKKCSKYYSLKVVMIVVALFSFVDVNAQTFICTDVTFSDWSKQNATEAQMYQLKKKLLGSICTIETFDNNLKFKSKDADGNTEEYLYTKIGENKYRIEDTIINYDTYDRWKWRSDLEIQTRFGYYTSITLKAYRDGKLIQTLTAKRK